LTGVKITYTLCGNNNSNNQIFIAPYASYRGMAGILTVCRNVTSYARLLYN